MRKILKKLALLAVIPIMAIAMSACTPELTPLPGSHAAQVPAFLGNYTVIGSDCGTAELYIQEGDGDHQIFCSVTIDQTSSDRNLVLALELTASSRYGTSNTWSIYVRHAVGYSHLDSYVFYRYDSDAGWVFTGVA